MEGSDTKGMESFFLLINNFGFFLCIIIVAINLFGIFLRKQFKKKIFFKNGKIIHNNDWAYNFTTLKDLTEKVNYNMIHFKRMPKSNCTFFENYFLYILSFLPFNHFKDYEFYNIKRILDIGYGWCSQFSILVHLCLKKKGINSRIIGFKGHVLVHACMNKKDFLLDPDYGIILKIHPKNIKKSIKKVIFQYKKGNVTKKKLIQLEKIYKSEFESVPDKVIKRNIFIEETSYFIKWFLPISLIIIF